MSNVRNPLSSSYDQDAPIPPSKSGMGSKFAQAFKKRTTEEKEARRRQKEGGVTRSKTVGSRMDVIDKLDVSGFHGSSMFHHDSPYDACTPHANRSTKRAPVKAFDPNAENLNAMSLNGNGPRRGPSEGAPSAYRRQDSGFSEDKDRPPGARTRSSRSFTSPQVPSLPMNGTASTSAVNLPSPPVENYGVFADAASVTTDSTNDADGERVHRHRPSASRQASNPMREMWGLNEDEPWQDFASPTSREKARKKKAQQSKNGMLSPYGTADSINETPSAASSVLDMEAVLTGKTAEQRLAQGGSPSEQIAGVSPFPEPDYDAGSSNGPAPGRSKSLLRRIKSARQNPNVPPPDDDGVEMQGRGASRRYGPHAHAHAHRHSPSSPPVDRTEWSSLTSPGLGVGGGSSSLGRNGTRKPRRDDTTPQAVTGDEYFDPRLKASSDDRQGGGDVGGGGISPAEHGNSGATVGRSSSIFGRFGRRKGGQ